MAPHVPPGLSLRSSLTSVTLQLWVPAWDICEIPKKHLSHIFSSDWIVCFGEDHMCNWPFPSHPILSSVCIVNCSFFPSFFYSLRKMLLHSAHLNSGVILSCLRMEYQQKLYHFFRKDICSLLIFKYLIISLWEFYFGLLYNITWFLAKILLNFNLISHYCKGLFFHIFVFSSDIR